MYGACPEIMFGACTPSELPRIQFAFRHSMHVCAFACQNLTLYVRALFVCACMPQIVSSSTHTMCVCAYL